MRGLLRVVTYLPDSQALLDMKQAIVAGKTYPIDSVRRTHDAWLLAVRGIATRDQADALRGGEVHALRSELPPLQDNEWYLADLVGLRAIRPDGRALGVVHSVSDYGAGDILVLRGPSDAGSAERMVPLVPGVLQEVRLEDGVVVLAPPEIE